MKIFKSKTLREQLIANTTLSKIFYPQVALSKDNVDYFTVRRLLRKTQPKLHNKLLKAARKGQLGVSRRGHADGNVSTYFTERRNDLNKSAIAAGRKPVHHNSQRGM